MRILIFLPAFFVLTVLYGQPTPLFTPENFAAEVLTYQPPQRAGVSDSDYDFAKMVLRENIRQTNNDPDAFDRSDYFQRTQGVSHA